MLHLFIKIFPLLETIFGGPGWHDLYVQEGLSPESGLLAQWLHFFKAAAGRLAQEKISLDAFSKVYVSLKRVSEYQSS